MRSGEMTKNEAADITIEVWEYLRDHPEIKHKSHIPTELFSKIMELSAYCALCHIHDCDVCPLGDEEEENCKDYYSWYSSNSKKSRARAARVIVEKVKAWKATLKEGE